MRAHHAGERVAVGDADPGKPERGGARDQLLRMRRAAQEREIRRRRQLGVAAREADHLPSPLAGRRWTRAARPDEGSAHKRLSGGMRLTARPLAPDPSPARAEGKLGARLHHGRPHRARIVSMTLARSLRIWWFQNRAIAKPCPRSHASRAASRGLSACCAPSHSTMRRQARNRRSRRCKIAERNLTAQFRVSARRRSRSRRHSASSGIRRMQRASFARAIGRARELGDGTTALHRS